MKQEEWRQFVTEFDLSLAVPETVSYTQHCHQEGRVSIFAISFS